jgi:hypothetical protein
MNHILRAASLLFMPQPLLLSTMKIKTEISDDTWNKIPQGDIRCQVHTPDGHLVGNFNYRIKTGQVGGMFIAERFRFQALEQQMLIYMMKDMQDAGAKQIWEVVSNENSSGPRFYSALWSFAFVEPAVHPSVTGSGYAMDIPRDIRTLTVLPGIGIYERN